MARSGPRKENLLFTGSPHHLREAARISKRIQDSGADVRERMRERGADTDEPDEQLVCPRCRMTYDMGTSCHDCHVPLVGASLVDAYEVPLEDHMARRVLMFAGMIAAGLAFLVWLV